MPQCRIFPVLIRFGHFFPVGRSSVSMAHSHTSKTYGGHPQSAKSQYPVIHHISFWYGKITAVRGKPLYKDCGRKCTYSGFCLPEYKRTTGLQIRLNDKRLSPVYSKPSRIAARGRIFKCISDSHSFIRLPTLVMNSRTGSKSGCISFAVVV